MRLVMVPLGGPHVFATYTRTFLNPRFAREDRTLLAVNAGVAVTRAGIFRLSFVLPGGSAASALPFFCTQRLSL